MPPELPHERKRLGELLRRVREESDLRQIDVANKLNQPQSYISRIESGEQRLEVLELRALCLALGVRWVALLQRFEEEQ